MKGAIAASHPKTVEAGISMLEQGGNAVDAAVAASFASFVAEPVLTSIGGSGIALVSNGQGKAASYDFFSTMPSGEVTPMADFRRITVDFGATTQDFYIGRASVAVPGAVAGLCLLAEQEGTLPLPTLLAPAIRMAHEGSLLTPFTAHTLRLLEPIFTNTPEIAAVFAPGGKLLTAGARVRIAGFADLLTAIAEQGAAAFYQGPAAEAFIADQQAHHGLVRAEDLATYQAKITEPLRVPYRQFEVLLPGYPSNGGVWAALAFKLMERLTFREDEFLSPRHLQVLADVMRTLENARTDLPEEKSAPAQSSAPFPNAEYLARYAATLPLSPSASPGRGVGNTTHISVIDAAGTTVSITTTAGEAAGYIVPGTGVIPNNMLGEIDLHPNGFHRLPPGHRLTTMMTPAILLHRGRPVLAVGSGGSSRIRAAVFQVLSHVVDFKRPLASAVTAPRVYYQNGLLQVEGGMSPESLAHLSNVGYRLNVWQERSMYFGGANAVAFHDGIFEAAGDPRRGGETALQE